MESSDQIQEDNIINSELYYGSSCYLYLTIITCGVLLRLLLASISTGTNDMLSWGQFALYINEHGLQALYQSNKDFNHPPLMGYYAYAAFKLAELTHSSFYFIFKLPVIIFDVFNVLLLFQIWKYFSRKEAWKTCALYSLSLIAILVSGYHGNTDTIYCFFTLFSAFLLERKRKYFYSGLALGVAINIKLIPIIFLFPLLFALKNREELGKWGLGFMAGMSPLFITFLMFDESFIRNVFFYKPYVEYWGISLFLLLSRNNNPDMHDSLTTALNLYASYSKLLIMALVFMLAFINRLRGTLTIYEVMAVSAATFLIFAPGFGLQYLAIVALLIYSCDQTWGLRLSNIAGLAAMSSYYYALVSWSPLLSLHYRSAPKIITFMYAIVWLYLIYFALGKLFFDQNEKTVPQTEIPLKEN